MARGGQASGAVPGLPVGSGKAFRPTLRFAARGCQIEGEEFSAKILLGGRISRRGLGFVDASAFRRKFFPEACQFACRNPGPRLSQAA